ncbi:hypothetical protein GGG16DRAFT_68246 [Schizophyllum commune]
MWIGPEDPRNKNVRIEGTNQTGEVAGALLAAQTAHEQTSLQIVSDSEFVIEGLTKRLSKFEDNGWIGVSDGEYMKALVGQLRSRQAATTLRKVKGHSGDHGNDGADAEAAKGAQKPEIEPLNLYIDPSLRLDGARLCKISQKVAYLGVRRAKSATHYTPSTKANLDVIRWAMDDLSGRKPSDQTIWKALHHPDLQPKIRTFLWWAIRNGFWLGPQWLLTLTMRDRAYCPTCGDIESMDHVMTKCTAPGSEVAWEVAHEFLRAAGDDPPAPSIGGILECAVEVSLVVRQQMDAHLKRLRVIILSEIMYLIWKIQCKRVIGGKQHANREVANRAQAAIEARFSLEALLAKPHSRDRKTKRFRTLFLQTWKKTPFSKLEPYTRIIQDQRGFSG